MLEEDKDCKIGSTDQDYYLLKNVLDDKEILGDLDDNECENGITNQDFNDDDEPENGTDEKEIEVSPNEKSKSWSSW